MRALCVLLALVATIRPALADDSEASRSRAKLEEAGRAITFMRDSYAYVMRKEGEAKSARDPIRLNSLHQIAQRIGDLVNVADHSLDDMRVAISSQEPGEAIDAELEKIILVKEKVRRARDEADRAASGETTVVVEEPKGPGGGFDSENSNLTATPPGSVGGITPSPCPVTNGVRPPPPASQTNLGTTGSPCP
jgi:acyl-CoA reductase-like NAD-dependent aldehyde dehydrogenase